MLRWNNIIIARSENRCGVPIFEFFYAFLAFPRSAKGRNDNFPPKSTSPVVNSTTPRCHCLLTADLNRWAPILSYYYYIILLWCDIKMFDLIWAREPILRWTHWKWDVSKRPSFITRQSTRSWLYYLVHNARYIISLPYEALSLHIICESALICDPGNL